MTEVSLFTVPQLSSLHILSNTHTIKSDQIFFFSVKHGGTLQCVQCEMWIDACKILTFYNSSLWNHKNLAFKNQSIQDSSTEMCHNCYSVHMFPSLLFPGLLLSQLSHIWHFLQWPMQVGNLCKQNSCFSFIHVCINKKSYNTPVLPTFLYGSENWTLTALQRWRIEATEMKLFRPLAGYTLYDRKQMTTHAANYRLQAY